jgi:hypothetical protein
MAPGPKPKLARFVFVFGMAVTILAILMRALPNPWAHASASHTREFPWGRLAQLLATSDAAHRLTRVGVVPKHFVIKRWSFGVVPRAPPLRHEPLRPAYPHEVP